MSGKSTRRTFIKYGVRAAIAAGLGKGVYNTTGSQLETLKVPVRIKDLPPGFKDFKIAFLSDFHASMIANYGLFAEAAAKAMEFEPDMIALGGDYISGEMKFLSGSIGEFDKDRLDGLLETLKNLSAPHGIYGVLGNHDFWSGAEAVTIITDEFSRKLGVKWLRNENGVIEKDGGKITILGVDDYWSNSSSLAKAYRGAPDDMPKILLSHNPDINETVIPQMKIDLILSGHTHGGQVSLPVIGAPLIPSQFGQKYRAGLVRDGERQTFVSKGVGYLMAPVRFNCPPDVALLTLA